MQENKFEKQVREEMEEFRIRPSATVWNGVEEELRRKKRRRVVVYWFLLAAIGLGAYGVYNLFTPSMPGSSAPMTSAQKQKTTSSSPATAGQPAIATRPAHTVSPSSVPGTTDQPAENNDSNTIENNTNVAVNNNTRISGTQPAGSTPVKPTQLITGNKKPVAHKKYADNNSFRRQQQAGKITESLVDKDGSVKADNKMLPVAPAVTNDPSENKETGELAQTETAREELASDATVSITGQDRTKDSADISSDHQDLAQNPPTRITASRRRIQWGIEVGIGAGNRMDKALPPLFATEKMLDVNNLPAYGGINGGIPAPRPLLLPSESKASVGFKIGVQASIPVSRRINLVAGLRYAYRSDRITVGGSLDSTLAPSSPSAQFGVANRAYQYQGAQHQSVTNRYHFIQLPVQWQLQLNKGKNLPITWEIGITPGLLVHTNAMIYDTSYYGIYYRDKDAFSRFQLHAETGFSLHLGNRSKWRWAIGPEFNFALTPLIKEAYDPRQFLLYGGLRAQIQIPKKK